MDIHSASVQELPDIIYEQLYLLNHGPRGMMQRTLHNLRHDNFPHLHSGIVYYMMEGDNVVGWTLVFTIERDITQTIQYLYVNSLYRSKGIGSALAHHGVAMHEGIRGHTYDSTCFTNAGHIPVNKDYMFDIAFF